MKVRRSRASPPEAIDTLARSVARARRVPWRASGTGSPSRAATSPAKPGVGDHACAPVTASAWQRGSPGSGASRQTCTANRQVPSARPSPSQVGSPSVQRATRPRGTPATSVTSMQSVFGGPPPRKRMKGPVCAGVATGCSTIAPAKAAHANGRGVMRATFRQRTSALRSRRIGLLREDANFGPVLLVHAIDRLERVVGRIVEPEQVAVLVLLGVGAERERLGAVVLPGAGPLEALARLEFQLPAL